MSLFTLPPAQPQLPKRFPGSPHWGRDWNLANRNLRAAIENAIEHAWQLRFTPDQVGTEVTDLVCSRRLDSQALAVLHVVIGELAKQTKKRARPW